VPLAWRFHRVHHSEEEVDVTTVFRQHPGESVWRVLWQLPAVLLLGLPLSIVVCLTIPRSTRNSSMRPSAFPNRSTACCAGSS
jgi:sterol desaturase/sphingolipid hydroxylase (fatty acid hydroxylase superfamily)